MNCPVCHGSLEKTHIDFKSTFPCPHCRQSLRARANVRVRVIQWIGFALAMLAFAYGDLKHLTNVKLFAIAGGAFVSLGEGLLEQTHDAEIEPASTQGSVRPLG
jgi:hypothetical protein